MEVVSVNGIEEKIYSIIGEDPEERDKFLALEEMPEMYEFISRRDPSISKESFDEHVCKLLNNYFSQDFGQDIKKLDDNSTGNVTGGSGSLLNKALSGFLGLLAMVPGLSSSVGAKNFEETRGKVENRIGISENRRGNSITEWFKGGYT